MATTENLNTLKIHKLSQEQYDREKEAGRLDNSAIYLTPESDDSAPSNMVTTDTDQTITGVKVFTGQRTEAPDRGVTISEAEIVLATGNLDNETADFTLLTTQGLKVGNTAESVSAVYGINSILVNEAEELLLPNQSGTLATQEHVETEVQSLKTEDNLWTGSNQFSLANTTIGERYSTHEPYCVQFADDGMLFTAMKGEQGGDYYWIPSIKLTTMGPPDYTEFKKDRIVYSIYNQNQELSDGTTIDSELIFPQGEKGILATKEWVNSVIAGKVDYLGLVANQEELYNAAYAAGTKLTPGDYARASVDFTLPAYSLGVQGEQVHTGDILIFKSLNEYGSPEPYIDYWDIIHTEDPGKYVTLDTDQTLTGKKTFNGGFEAVDAVFNTSATFNGGIFLSSNGKWLNIDPTGVAGENESQQIYNVSFPTTTGTLATQEWVDESCERILTAIFNIDEAGTVVDLSNLTASYIDWGDDDINTEHSHEYTVGGVLRTCKIYGVTAINDNAFSGNSYLVSVTIGNGVKSIGVSAFCNCSGLTSVVIGDSVTSIGSGAFQYCSSLTSVEIPDSVTSIGGSAFYGCSNLTSVVIPDSVTSIGWYAFYGCSGLTSVVIPDSVTSIGGGSFEDCDNLKSVIIGDNVTSIGDSAFAFCSSLTEITIPFIGMRKGSGAQNYTTVFGYIFGYITSTNTNSIEGTTYQYNDGTNYYHYYIPASLKKVTITGGTIDECAFQNCSSLTSVVIGDSVTSISNGAFQNCSNLTSVVIGDSVTGIGNYAFYGCRSLTKIVIPDSVTGIYGHAFANCDSLTSITIPNSVISIDDCAFYDCDSLTSVVIGDSVTSIGFSAFSGCNSLTSVVIPDSVTSIGHEAFSYCDSLTEITIPFVGATKDGTVNLTFTYIFGSVPETLKKVKVTGGNISDGAFANCDSLTSVEIGDSVTSIGYQAFSRCSSLTSVVIPDSVTSIGYKAFEGCGSLTIYCEAESMPSGWAAGWNNTGNHVVWGYKKHIPAIETNIYNHLYAQELHAENSVELGLVEGNGSVGLIKNGSTETSATGYTACPIISGVPYYKGVDSTTSTNTLYLIGATATGNTSATTKAASGVSVVNKQVIADSFCANSDLRLKENITEFKPQTSILELPIVEFDFKETGTHQIGCIAQDLQKICPEIVEQGQDGFLKIQESKIVYLLLDEVRKLRAELDQLKEGKN